MFMNGQKIFTSVRKLRRVTGRWCNASRLNYSSIGTKSLMDHLKQRIQISGPMTVSSYMKECLSNPVCGYYMKKDVFGSKGDFTTSPEISQMFGELVAVWFIIQWKQMGKPSNVQLVELGPGRGTMMSDILRVMRQKQFKELYDCLSVHLVEVSEKMTEMQKQNLNITEDTQYQNQNVSNKFEKHVLPDSSIEVNWHSRIQDVPSGLSFYLAHEFFDVLPVHLFQRTDKKGWREILVNLSNTEDKLEFVTSPGASAISKSFISSDGSDYTSDKCEICPDAAVIMSQMSTNISNHGGCALIVDYGKEGSNYHSIRGFKDHKLIENILESPGDADLTANVDFSFLKRHTHESTVCYGPITQQSFLLQMGLLERLKVLLRTARGKQAKDLVSSYEYLVSPEKMGEKFKVMALGCPGLGTPTAFS